MADELIDICNENNNLLDIQKMKSEAHKDGLWHRAAHIWIYNSQGEVLLQLRASEKLLYPDMWDISAAGHVSAGEDPVISGLRELEEEIGLKVEKEALDFWMIRKTSSIFREIKNNEFYYVYFLKFDGDISQLKLQVEEVQQIQFFAMNQIEEELKANPGKYTPHGDYWFEALAELRKRMVG